MVFDPIVLSSLAQIAVAFAAAFIAALWLSLIFWTYRDIRRRTRDILLRVLASLVVTILFLPGLLIYLILRPPNTLEQEYQSTLEEEALLQTIEEAPMCPGCGRKIDQQWAVCPSCHTRLKKYMPRVRQINGIGMEPVPLLWHSRARDADRKPDHGRSAANSPDRPGR